MESSPRFSALLSRSVALLDGAMGTELARRGLVEGGQQNVHDPAAVESIHESYRAAGAEAIITNTLTMNRIFIESHGMDVDPVRVNTEGAAIARRAAGADRPVLGDISSTGQLLEPYGDWTEARFIEAFREQARVLAAGGVDAFLIETMIDLREALCALRSCRTECRLPVLVTLSFATVEKGGRTAMGNAAGDAAAALAAEGAAAVGANCGSLTPLETASVIAAMRERTDLPLIAQPNAGKPRLESGRTLFDMDPQRFAAGILECVRAGARLVGGCCGTRPEHIAAVAEALHGPTP